MRTLMLAALSIVLSLAPACERTSPVRPPDAPIGDSGPDLGPGPQCPVDAGQCPPGTFCGYVSGGRGDMSSPPPGFYVCPRLVPRCEAGADPCRCVVSGAWKCEPGSPSCSRLNDAGTAAMCWTP